jgi:hypothetical protein
MTAGKVRAGGSADVSLHRRGDVLERAETPKVEGNTDAA